MHAETAEAPLMKAWVCRAYGGPEVLALEDRPRPVPGRGEVLVRIHATTVSSGDARVRALRLPRGFGPLGRPALGFLRPRRPILGTEFAGIVEAVGPGVADWSPGDAVIGFPGAAFGCHAEYRVMAADGPLAPKPAGLPFGEAAGLCFGGTTAMHFLRKAGLRPGEKLLVIGASGAVGSAMVQLARHAGAEVTGVTSTGNVGLVRDLGAAAVIDYAVTDVAATGGRWDVVADSVGASSFAACRDLLAEHGRYLGIAADLLGTLPHRSGTRRSIAGPAAERPEDVRELARLAAAGVLKPVVDSVVDFARLPDAHARVDTGRKRGSVVVSLAR